MARLGEPGPVDTLLIWLAVNLMAPLILTAQATQATLDVGARI